MFTCLFVWFSLWNRIFDTLKTLSQNLERDTNLAGANPLVNYMLLYSYFITNIEKLSTIWHMASTCASIFGQILLSQFFLSFCSLLSFIFFQIFFFLHITPLFYLQFFLFHLLISSHYYFIILMFKLIFLFVTSLSTLFRTWSCHFVFIHFYFLMLFHFYFFSCYYIVF